MSNTSTPSLSKGLKNYFFPHQFSYIDKIRSEKIIGSLSGKKVLDAGCGRGNLSYLAHENGFDVTAIDLSKSSLKDSSFLFDWAGCDISLVEASLTDLPFEENEFDSVICSDVLEHVPDAKKAMSEIRRVLKPGGRLVLTVPNPNTFDLFYEKFALRVLPEKKQIPIAYKRHYGLTDEEIEKFGWAQKETYPHCQDFTLGKLKKFVKECGFEVHALENLRVLDPYIRSACTLLGVKKVAFFQKMDIRLASIMPQWLAADWIVNLQSTKAPSC